MSPITCAQCNREVNEQAEYCPNCGAQITVVNSAQPSDGSSSNGRRTAPSLSSSKATQPQKNQIAVFALALAVLSVVCIPGRSSAGQVAIPGGIALGFTAVALYRLFFQRHRWNRQHYTLIAALLNAFGIYMGIEAHLRQKAAVESVSQGAAQATTVPGGTYLDHALAHFDQQLRGSPEIEAALTRFPEADRVAQANALASRGLRDLPSTELIRHVELQLAMLARTDSRTCAQMVRGGDVAAMERGLRTLNESELRDWFDGMFAAAQVALHKPKSAADSDRETATALRQMFSEAPRADAERARSLFAKQLAQLADKDACWLERFLAEQTLKTPEPQRSLIARALMPQSQD